MASLGYFMNQVLLNAPRTSGSVSLPSVVQGHNYRTHARHVLGIINSRRLAEASLVDYLG